MAPSAEHDTSTSVGILLRSVCGNLSTSCAPALASSETSDCWTLDATLLDDGILSNVSPLSEDKLEWFFSAFTDALKVLSFARNAARPKQSMMNSWARASALKVASMVL